MKPLQISRRSFITAAAASGMAAGWRPAARLRGQGRGAGATGMPKRLLLIYWSGGTAFGSYLPTGTETNWQLSPR
jgi:hypothetical protein